MTEYKALLELVNDEESCKKIFESVFDGVECNFTGVRQEGNWLLQINGTSLIDNKATDCAISLWQDGDVFFSFNEKDETYGSIFQFVDFVRSLGYSNI